MTQSAPRAGRIGRRGEAGTTAIEFAVVGSVFITLLLLTVETCWQLTVGAALDYGADAASRFGVTGASTPAGMNSPPASRSEAVLRLVVESTGGVLLASRLSMSEASYPTLADIGDSTKRTNGLGGPSQVVQYTLSYAQPYLTGLPSFILQTNVAIHHASVTVVNEPFPSP